MIYIYINENGYFERLFLDHGDIHDTYLGKTREEAIKGLALDWVDLFAHYNGRTLFPGRKYTDMKMVKEFVDYCKQYLK